MIITLTHANQPGIQVDFMRSQIFYYQKSEAQKCTIVVSIGGAFCPVKETVEQVRALLSTTEKKEETNGI